MSAANAIDRLRRIARCHSDRGIVAVDDAEWFAAALEEFEAGARHGLELGTAFGFERGWREGLARARRDQILRDIASRFYQRPTYTARSAATEISRELGRYESRDWVKHKARAAPPPELRGTLRAELFALLKIGMPAGLSTIRAALANDPPLSAGHDSIQDGASTGEER